MTDVHAQGQARRKVTGVLKSPLLWLLVVYLLVCTTYSIITPIFEASDELWHYPMVKYLADHGLALPVQDPKVDTAWRQEGSQPPLYYMLGAVLTSWIDTSDLTTARKINPHADIGVLVPDGNVNMVIHDPAVEGYPWRGSVLALHLVRFLSVALGAVTVCMTYLLARELFPAEPRLALAAALFTAFNPMFLFISGAVNNDNLSNALASVLLVLIVRLLKRKDAPGLPALILIGVIAGAGMIAKFNIGFLLPIIAVSLAINAYKLRQWRPFLLGAAVTGILTVAIAGWWYLRNWQLYGDPTGLNMFISIVGPRPIPANLAQLWSERQTFMMSYWGFFGGVNVPLPDFMYTVFNVIVAVGVLGLMLAVLRAVLHSLPGLRGRITDGLHGLLAGIKKAGSGVGWPILLGRIFTALWIIVLFVSLLRWTSATWASQGRLMFSAIAPISMWLAVGLWLAGRPFRRVGRRPLAYAAAWYIVAAMLGLKVIDRAYGDPYLFTNAATQFSARNYSVVFYEPGRQDPAIRVYTPGPLASLVTVGDYLQFCTYMGLEQGFTDRPFSKDWTIYVHVVNRDNGLIVAQRDLYPGQGQWATSAINLGFGPLAPIGQGSPPNEWCNRFAVQIPDYAYAPQDVDVYLGFYDLKTGQRMQRFYGDGSDLEPVFLGQTTIIPRPSPYSVTNSMRVNFGGEAELVGYDVSSLVLQPGGDVTVTLYWRALRPMTTDYRVFTQVVQPNTTNVYGQNDAMPVNWTRPTTTWKVGEIIEDKHTFKINPDTPLDTFQFAVGMYQLTPDQQFRRLRIVTPDGGEAEDLLYLSRVKIAAP